MAIERESTRLFREARRARRLLGDRAGEAAAAQLGEYASKVAATEPAGIGSRDERMARQTLRRQSAALASGFRPNGAAATGDALAARQDLFKRMQAAGSQGAAQFRSEAASLGVSDVGFDRALRNVGGSAGVTGVSGATDTPTYTPPPATTPQTTADSNIPKFLRRTQQTVATAAAPVSMINGKPASEVLGPRADQDLTKADILRRAREESATNPSVTRQDVIDRLNAERRDKGMVDVNITGKELAAADIEQQTNVEAASSLQGQKFFNTMDTIEASLKPKTGITQKPATAGLTPAAPKQTASSPYDAIEPTDAEIKSAMPSDSRIVLGTLSKVGRAASAVVNPVAEGIRRIAPTIPMPDVTLGQATQAAAAAVAPAQTAAEAFGRVGAGAAMKSARESEMRRIRNELRAKKAAQLSLQK